MWQPSSALRSSQNFLGPSIMVAATVDFKDWAPPHSYSPISYDTSVVQISFCQTSFSDFRILTSIRGCISCLQCQLSWCTFPALFKSCQSSIPTQAQQIVLRWLALFDMPNLNRFDILSILIFCKIALSISISIFSKITISILISISIFFKSIDISTIDMSYQYIEQG